MCSISGIDVGHVRDMIPCDKDETIRRCEAMTIYCRCKVPRKCVRDADYMVEVDNRKIHLCCNHEKTFSHRAQTGGFNLSDGNTVVFDGIEFRLRGKK